ncbi:MAG: hypothetical protein FWC10_06725 [Lentimicrobiaceae bacterium]|nr:hypothetical protein [Lentimicrobiaceae bacterium]MCL2246789.1 hypothetical protein [Lentimicrobiaceae bacterium]
MITEIANTIKQAFIDSSILRGLYGLVVGKTFDEQFSAVSLEALTIEAHATAGAAVQTMHEWHLAETRRIVEQERYGYAGWYAKMMLAFQFGFDLNELEEQTFYSDTTSQAAIDARIIKFAFAFDNVNSIGVTMKISKADQYDKPEPLDSFELTAATSYINRIKPAGIPIRIVNEAADILNISVKIVYDPLSFPSETAVNDAVETAINTYLNGIEFNGAFVSMRMIDQLQITRGIRIALVDSIGVIHAGYPLEDITELTSYIPASGAMKLGTLNVIKEVM